MALSAGVDEEKPCGYIDPKRHGDLKSMSVCFLDERKLLLCSTLS